MTFAYGAKEDTEIIEKSVRLEALRSSPPNASGAWLDHDGPLFGA